MGGSPCLWILSPGALPGSQSEKSKKIPLCSQWGEDRRSHFEICQRILFFLNKFHLQQKWFYQNILVWEWRHPIIAPLTILYHQWEGKSEKALAKFTAQGHRFTERLRPNHVIIECFLSPHSTSCSTWNKKFKETVSRTRLRYGSDVGIIRPGI